MSEHTAKLLKTGAFLLAVLMILLVASFNYLYKLGDTPLVDWDEARHGVSAYEMLQSGDYIVNTYLGDNDYWNLKPPLTYWLIALCYKIVGYNAWGLRLYSALSGVGVVLVTILMGKKLAGRLAGLTAGVIVATAYLFTEVHAMRHGDADALFVLLATLSVYFLATSWGKGYRLALSVTMFSLAFLAKSWHALAILAVIGLYWLGSRSWRWMKWQDYAYCVAGLLPIVLWAIFRFRADGWEFFKTMYSYDMAERTSKAIEGHAQKWDFYIRLVKRYFGWWDVVTAFGAVLGLAVFGLRRFKKLSHLTVPQEPSSYRYAVLALGLGVVVPLAAFTLVPTKLFWYTFSIYPCMAVLCGILVRYAVCGWKNRWVRGVALGVAAALVLACGTVYELKCVERVNVAWNEGMEDAMRALDREKTEGCRAFSTLSVYGNEGWDQDQALGAELFCGMVPRQGSLKAFAWDYSERAIVFMRRDQVEELMNYMDMHDVTRIGGWDENGVDYLIFQKRK